MRANPSPEDEGPLMALAPFTLAVTQFGGTTAIVLAPIPDRSFTASGNFSIFLIDNATGGAQLKVLDDTYKPS